MTAEIAIMNREAIALAADSAVTMVASGGEKIFTSANKLFALSKYHPVGIMVYGNATFMGVPWEIIIKMYRTALGKRKFDSLDDYAEDFLNFLTGPKELFPEEIQGKYYKSMFTGYFLYLRDNIEKKVKKQLENKGKLTDSEVKSIVTSQIEEEYKIWGKTPLIDSLPDDFLGIIERKYKKEIEETINKVFEKLPIGKKVKEHLIKIAIWISSKFPGDSNRTSGIVIAGYGEKDIFPALISFKLEAIIENTLKYIREFSEKVNHKTRAVIIPFAQREMVHTFMEGVDPNYIRVEQKYLAEIFKQYSKIIINEIKWEDEKEKKGFVAKLEKANKEILKYFQKKTKDFREKNYAIPVINVVSFLPKDELAAMAESLINLTSLKRRYTLEKETVAGPIDVAVISKGDGFIWIKRKHYFTQELNPHFFKRYFMEVNDEEEKEGNNN